MKKTENRGFTLIELLVVIAIIGILAAVVLTSLSSARNSARDASAQGTMNSMRAAAEIIYSQTGSYDTVCNTGSETMRLLIAADSEVVQLNRRCYDSASEWAAAINLNAGTGSNNYFCVDSTGFSGGRSNHLPVNATVCPSS